MADANQTKGGIQYMWEGTREKWRRIAAVEQRDIVVVLDNAADRELGRLGIESPKTEPEGNEQIPANDGELIADG